MEDRCVCCGTIIPEGQQVCPNCMERADQDQALVDFVEFAIDNGFEISEEQFREYKEMKINYGSSFIRLYRKMRSM